MGNIPRLPSRASFTPNARTCSSFSRRPGYSRSQATRGRLTPMEVCSVPAAFSGWAASSSSGTYTRAGLRRSSSSVSCSALRTEMVSPGSSRRFS